mgnify:CR=1 FL=1
MKAIHIFVFSFLITALLPGEDLRVDTEELQGALKERILFENYEGIPDKVETMEQIRGIGVALAGEEGRASTGKYTVIHAVDPSTPAGLDADLFILEPEAAVDHIRNLRWIVGSYLEAQYGYGRSDADLLSQFITIYNAVYRKNLPYLKERYKPLVISYLDSEKVGLARSYRQWPGNTQMLIPLSGPQKKGILSIETGTLTEKPVLEELRKEEDRGIPLRKEMVELKERQLKEEEQQLSEEKKALELEKEKLHTAPTSILSSEESNTKDKGEVDAVKRDLGPSSPAASGTVPPGQTPSVAASPGASATDTPPPPTPGKAPLAESSQAPEEKPVPEEKAAEEPLESSRELQELSVPSDSIAQKEEELKAKERQLQEKQQAIREERVAIATDQQELLESKALQAARTVPFLFMEKEGPRLVLVEENSGTVMSKSSEFPLKQSMFQPFGGGYLVVLPRGSTGGRLCLLDPVTLQARVINREEIYGLGKVKVHESVCFAILREGSEWFVGKFDTTLALLARSRVPVLPETDLSFQGEKLYVQTPDGMVAVLNLDLSSP